MRVIHMFNHQKIVGTLFCWLLLTSVMLVAVNIELVSADPYLELDWTANIGAQTSVPALAAELDDDIPGLEIVVSGIRETSSGAINTVWALKGTDGSVLWSRDLPSAHVPDDHLGHLPCEIADLDGDEIPEVIIPANSLTIALHGNNGTTYWETEAPSAWNWIAVQDIDGDDHPESSRCTGIPAPCYHREHDRFFR